MRIAAFAAAIAAASMTFNASGAGEARLGLEELAANEFNVLEANVVSLDAPANGGDAFSINIPLEGQNRTLHLKPHSVRSQNFSVQVEVEPGVYREYHPAAPQTFRGTVEGLDGALVAGGIDHEGFRASILLADGEKIWVEPIFNRVRGADFDDYVVYRSSHILDAPGFCAVLTDDEDQAPDARAASRGTPVLRAAETAIDCDYEFFLDLGSSVSNCINRVELLINNVNLQYENSVGIVHEITTIIVRETSSDPYTSNNASTLLSQFRSHWNNQQGGIQRDMAHLFTGRNMNGGTIGIAFLGVVCTSSAYGVSEASNFSIGCATDLIAHEKGHNWNASHCSCPSNTMNPSLTCSRVFAQVSINSILAHKNTRGCLSAPTPAEPPASFGLLAPADGATGVAQSPLFQWEASDGAADYRIQIDDDPDFGSPLINLTTVLTSYEAVGDPLAPGEFYFWRIIARNDVGQTTSSPSSSQFLTNGPAPGSFVLATPGAGTEVPEGNVSFLWTESSAAIDYLIEVDNNADFSSPEFSTTVVDDGSVSFTADTNLAAGDWNWRVTARNNIDEIVALPGTVAFTVVAPTTCDGDVDGNGVTDVNDITTVVNNLGSAGPLGDADGNGAVDVNDITFVVNDLGCGT